MFFVFFLKIDEHRCTVVQNRPCRPPIRPPVRPAVAGHPPSARPPVRPPSALPPVRPSARAGAGRTYVHKLPINRHGRLLLVFIVLAWRCLVSSK